MSPWNLPESLSTPLTVCILLLQMWATVKLFHVAVKYCFIEKKILGSHFGDQSTGKDAVVRGVLFVVLGGIALVGTVYT